MDYRVSKENVEMTVSFMMVKKDWKGAKGMLEKQAFMEDGAIKENEVNQVSVLKLKVIGSGSNTECYFCF